MYIEFVRGATAGPGFAATWSSVAAASPAPSGKVPVPQEISPLTLVLDLDHSWYWHLPGTGKTVRDARRDSTCRLRVCLRRGSSRGRNGGVISLVVVSDWIPCIGLSSRYDCHGVT